MKYVVKAYSSVAMYSKFTISFFCFAFLSFKAGCGSYDGRNLVYAYKTRRYETATCANLEWLKCT